MTIFSYRRAGVALMAGLVFWSASAYAVTLITDDEAKRPNDPQLGATRGITRGPAIHFEPPATVPAPHAPFDFHVNFEAHGGAKVDPDHIRITYLKSPNVDLTERLRPYITPEGIDMPAAQLPLGDHSLHIEVEDTDGRSGEATFTVKVAK
ncbi:MAG TPA: hypothetical protein VN809_02455 [Telmatospirillum sp.]|nr:hypothetical protein [Telmatospirillum sp.]